MRSLELFSGAGGLALGTHLAGFRHEALFEWDRDARKTLAANSARAVEGIDAWQVCADDIRSVDFTQFRELDLIAGGPPCQPFSIGGKHRGRADHRNLVPEFVRAVGTLRPQAFIMENVRGLLRESFSTFFEYVLLQLTFPTEIRRARESWTRHLGRLENLRTNGGQEGESYNVVFRLVNAADYGVPQTRERVFIVGFRSDIAAEWHFPEPTHSKRQLLHDQWVSGSYWATRDLPQPKCHVRESALARLRTVEVFKTAPWRTVADAIQGLPDPNPTPSSEFANHQLNPGARAYKGHTGSQLHWPAKTLKAGVHGVPGGENMLAFGDGRVRYFTVREAARLQTFPDEWRFEGAWSEAMRQLGNAVPVELGAVIASSISASLKSSTDAS